MAQGRLTVAQLEIELGRPDSALVALRRAVSGGEDSRSSRSSRCPRGKLLSSGERHEELERLRTRTAFSRVRRLRAIDDAVEVPDRRDRIRDRAVGAHRSHEVEGQSGELPAREARRRDDAGRPYGLHAGEEMFAEAAKQSLEYLDQLDPYVGQELAAYCGERPPVS